MWYTSGEPDHYGQNYGLISDTYEWGDDWNWKFSYICGNNGEFLNL